MGERGGVRGLREWGQIIRVGLVDLEGRKPRVVGGENDDG